MDAQKRKTAGPHKATAGFTIIELAIVVVILGILAVMAIPNFLRAQERAKRGSCLSNQRQLIEAALLYSADTGTLDGVLNAEILHQTDYVGENMCECPSSTDGDNNDYDITLVGGDVDQILCSERGVEHQLNF
jgi:prepilin-type N-terminal cleavage/methylation domain-containing protein